jgi:hypothetical protein
MWIFLNTGFISVVQDRRDATRLIVRARRPEVLSGLFANEIITTSDYSDYKYRIMIPYARFSDALSREIYQITYDNFKSSVSDACLNHLYHRIWELGQRFQR